MALQGYNDIVKLHSLTEELAKLGLKFAAPKWTNGDLVSLMPLDSEALPVYTRDAAIFTGTIQEVEAWICGVAWRDTYTQLLKLTTPEDITKAEQNYRNEQLMIKLKTDISNPSTIVKLK